MIALDTNVLVRVVVADDPAQLEQAVAVMESGPLWLSKTVLLETEWVLRYSYDLPAATIAATFERLLGLRDLHVEDRASALAALGWYRQGLDFADALHIASARAATSFASFDRTLARHASRAGVHPRVELLGGPR